MVAAAPLDQLRSRFRALYRVPAPESLSRDLIARLVAHRLQEQRLGKLDPNLAGQIDRLDRHGGGQTPRRRLKPGTVLVREHGGVLHEVMVVPGGFAWNGETHASLSVIARRITGTSWNGPRFFGLRPAQKAPVPDVAGAQEASDA
ncbi:DUF2924 domain-containing protein [Methylobrevis pamukkalensis]|uniref:DUF2924 domain-containing protein n=1 Tax=Methylobrevis pamukkalensis TaxID=1439726 RepID=UPI001FD9B8A8|nr:DUF2924 domain-containing protein [Methylobrevis pamukkalensis]